LTFCPNYNPRFSQMNDQKSLAWTRPGARSICVLRILSMGWTNALRWLT
jgi:hypothetical protein